MVFVANERLRWVDADLQGVVNNAVYLTLFEQARFAYFQDLECMRGDAFPFLLGSTSIRFIKPGRPGMEVAIKTRVERLGGASFDMSYDVQHEDTKLASGTATLVWVDDKLSSTAMPDAVRKEIAEREGIPERG